MRARLRRSFGFLEGQPAFPIWILFALNAVDELDRSAFEVLAPEIRDAFSLSNTALGLIVGLFTVLILVGGLPLGALGDRVPRTKLVMGAAMAWASMSVLTGLAPVLAVLVIARIGSGLGRVTNEAVHPSLLADTYPPRIHGRVFGLHRAGNPTGRIVGPLLAGLIAAALGTWRAPFLILVVPTLVLAVLARRLVEPPRGASEDPALAAEAAGEAAVPFARAWRSLFAVPSLRRLYVSAFFGGGTTFALLVYVSLLFEDVFGIGEFGRGAILAGSGVWQLAGTVVGGVLADRARARSTGRIALVAGAAVAAIGAGTLVMGLAPVAGVAIVGAWLANLAIGVWTAPNIAVVTAVAPARVRSLAIGIGVMLFGVGGLVFTVLAGAIADGPGLPAAFATLAPVFWLAALVYLSAARTVDHDHRRALDALALEVSLKRERLLAGETALLVCRGLDVSYDGVQVLFGVDLTVGAGEIVAVLGTNGAGKSTLLRTISGVLHPVAGSVFLDGADITMLEPHETAASGIAHVSGGRGIFPSLTVRENLEMAAWLVGPDRRAVAAAVAEAEALFPVLGARATWPAAVLSGGEQAMLTLAHAFIVKPRLLLIDELSLGLAPTVAEDLLERVRAFPGRGTTVVLVEQSVTAALSVAERAIFMEKGEVRFSGPAADLAARDDLIRSVFLEGATGSGVSTARAAAPREGPAPATDGSPEPVLRVEDIAVTFGGIRAVDDVSLDLHAGRITGVIGPNGAGKTTLFDLISGFVAPESGRIVLGGEDVTALPAEHRARRGLGRSFQDARLFPSLTVAETLAVALERSVAIKDPVATALALPSVRAAEATVAERADELIERMGLAAFRDKFVGELSTGTRRIVDLACALAHEPRALILDEPSSGIAQAETGALAELLVRVADELGCAFLVIEHDVPLIASIAQDMIAMDVGRVIARGSPDEVTRAPAVVASYLGRAGPRGPRGGGGVE